MATGKYPFDCKGNDYQKLFKIIQNNQPRFPAHLEGTTLQDLILKLLMKVPEDRITI
jgi:serine/threonine protein kinase